MLGKKGGKRQTVREEAQVDTITMMNMFSCLQYVKGLELISGKVQLGPTNKMQVLPGSGDRRAQLGPTFEMPLSHMWLLGWDRS
jgi:hypothetical protein